MKTTHKIIVTLLSGLTLATLLAVSAVAAPKALLVAPGEPYGLPKFGFSSSNIQGYGERVLFVRPNSRAAWLGLESGDVILSLNGYPLTYRGSWNNALADAMYDGGYVQLRVRDVRTGRIVRRETFVGNGGGSPVEPYRASGPFGPTHVEHFDNHPTKNVTIKEIAKFFDKD